MTAAPADHDPALRDRVRVCALLTAPVVLLATVPPWQFTHWQWVSLALAAPVAVWGALPLHRTALAHLRHAATTADTLVSAAVLVAFGWSLYALLLGGAGPPGHTHPPGAAPVWSGAGGAIHLAAAATVTTVVLAGRHAEALARSRSGAAPPQRVPADRIGDRSVPAALVLAAATGGFWLGAGAGTGGALGAMVAVLVVACPCAPGLAAPAALLVGASRGAPPGIATADPGSGVTPVDALRLGGRIHATVRGSLGWAVAWHVVALPVAAAGLLDPLAAAAVMLLSCVSVVGNSLWGRRVAPAALVQPTG